VNIVTLLPFIVLIGAMFLMTRSAKNKQRQAAQMRDQMTPGTGVRTIGGMYATVKEIRDDTVLLEVAPGTHALYAKNAVGAVLEQEEYERIVNGTPADDAIDAVVPDDASALTSDDDAAEGSKVDFAKSEGDDADDAKDAGDAKEAAADAKDKPAKDDAQPEDAKRKGTDSE
jgi:preprotein translocase subunit YajC